ncbi:hypothetical protein SDC9_173661 [bioreactor metagenome]|uniref:RND efflux pump membrane fusion protein barrel-sandwich domain-containing protein n=1 Tax=bioreactor metagenome TaxID=1076179 RepID=A0A645GH19_9ZZZZ
MKLGSHIDNESTLLEIIDPTTFQAKLSVFPNDVPYIKKGQLTRIKLTNNNDTYSAILSSIGNTINDSSKTIDCFANINDKNFNLTINNIFIEAEIITKTDSAKALPIEAIIKSGNKHYILTLAKESDNKYFFNKIEVKIGRQNSKYVEFLNYNSNDKIIVKGTYNIIL